MKKLTFILIALLIMGSARSQNYITIPDANFAFFLKGYFPKAMDGNQLDTSHTTVKTRKSLDIWRRDIKDLTGIEYFISLEELDCSDNSLDSLPVLPPRLIRLVCRDNSISGFTALPKTLQVLDCVQNHLKEFPELPNSLIKLICSYNRFTSLPLLPNGLKELYCQANNLANLPELPDSLVSLYCAGNHLVNLPELPKSLELLYCSVNDLTELPELPNTLKKMDCHANVHTSLPNLPNSMVSLNCSGTGSQSFILSNMIKMLPALPNSLQFLDCHGNRLTELPDLPNTLTSLKCGKNSISCFPVFPNRLTNKSSFSIEDNPFTCLPNYVPAMDAATLAIPLCTANDAVNNPNGCSSFTGIIGSVFKDNDSDCALDETDLKPANIHLMLYDEQGKLAGQTYSASNGVYNFPDLEGTYTVKVDTVGMPYQIQCPHPGIDSTIIMTASNPVAGNINFSIDCKAGFDIGVKSVTELGLVFPGEQHKLRITAGDLSVWQQLHCADSISGQVEITVDGPVSYFGPLDGALVPNVDDNIYTYQISNFDEVDIMAAFGIVFTTNTTAQANEQICVHVKVSSDESDNNPYNNTYTYCYHVVNSLDPNSKEVFPVNVEPGYNDYFTYTIHFQNTGTANAININLTDTLDPRLDLNTFQVINYSHYNTTSVEENILKVNFPNIQLPDSTSDLEGSEGFIQYRIKPTPDLPEGTIIENTAYIYFDYNDPVETNTTSNLFKNPVLYTEQNRLGSTLLIYPNPAKNIITLENTDYKRTENIISLTNMQGQEVFREKITYYGKHFIDINNLTDGVYIISIRNGNINNRKKIVVKN